MRPSLARRVSAPLLLSLGLLVGLGAPASAQEALPVTQPPEGWWKALQVGWQAEFEMVMNGNAGRIEMELVELDGPNVVVRVRTFMGDREVADQQVKGDVTQPGNQLTDPGRLPPGTTVREAERERLTVDGHELECRVFELGGALEGRILHCAGLPPLFSAGKVVGELRGQGMTLEMRLVRYSGELLEQTDGDD